MAIYRQQGTDYVLSQVVRPSGISASYSEWGYGSDFGGPAAFVAGTSCRGTCNAKGTIAVFRDFGSGYVQIALKEGDPSLSTSAASFGTSTAMSAMFADGCARVSAGAPYGECKGR